MGPPLRNNGDRFESWKQFVGWWVTDKGVATVMLAAIAAGIWFGGPGLLRELKAMHAEQEASHKAVMAEMGARHERIIEKLELARDKDREVLQRFADTQKRTKDGT